MGQLDASFGAMLIATWVNAMLYMLEIIQAIRYYSKFKKDRPFLKAGVALALMVDTVGTGAACAIVYLDCVIFWGNPTALIKHRPSMPTSKNTFLTLFYASVALAAYAGGLAVGVILIQYPFYAESHKVVVPLAICFACSSAADVGLALGLVWQLHSRSMKSSFRSTQTMLYYLSSVALQTGSITALFQIAVLAVFLQDDHSNIAIALNMCTGRIYTLTMLYNLFVRRQARALAGGSNSLNTSALDMPPMESESISLGIRACASESGDADCHDETLKGLRFADIYRSPILKPHREDT